MRTVSHSPHRVVQSLGSTRESRVEISSCWSRRLHSCAAAARTCKLPRNHACWLGSLIPLGAVLLPLRPRFVKGKASF